MSIVVAVKKNNSIVMAADTLTCFGDDEKVPGENCKSAKFMRVGDSLFGGSGWGIYDDILNHYLSDLEPPAFSNEHEVFSFFLDLWKSLHERYPFVNDQAGSKDSPFGDLDSSFMIANPHGIFRVASDMSVTRFQQYQAIGSGSPYAMGAMHACYQTAPSAKQIAEEGVKAAIAFNVFCAGDVQVMEVAL